MSLKDKRSSGSTSAMTMPETFKMQLLQKMIPAIIVLFLLLPVTLPAQETMMNDINYSLIDKLVATAKINYPKMKMLQHKIDEAEVGINKAKLSWFDLITFTYLYSPTSTTGAVATIVNPTYTQGYQFAMYANLGNIFTKAPGVKMARQEYQIAQDNKNEYELNIEAIVKDRYFAYVRQTVILNIRTKNALDVESSMNQVKYKFEKGEVTYDDYNKALTAYATALQSKIEAESGVMTAKSDLEEMLGTKLEDVR